MKKLLHKTKDGLIINVTVKPGAKRTEIEGIENNVLKIKLKSPPHKGEANKELIEVLADYFGIAKSRLQIIKGYSSRYKIVKIEGDLD